VSDPTAVLGRVLRRTGLAFPRGVLGEETAVLAAELERGADGPTLDAVVTDAAAALWPELRPSTAAAVRMHLSRADGEDVRDLETALAWAETESPANPLARALVVRAAQELAVAVRRAEELLERAEPRVAAGGPDAAVTAARAVGAAAVVLLDLDPEDYAPEIADYVDAGETPAALDELARMTGDPETRAWARDAVRVLDPEGAPAAAGAARGLADGEPPADAASDAVWVPAVLALVDEAFERVLAEDRAAPGGTAPEG
jgi:hypothetical protein